MALCSISKNPSESWKESKMRELVGEIDSKFSPEWTRLFQEMQLALGYPLYDAYRFQFFRFFEDELGQNINFEILLFVIQRDKIANPARAMRAYKKYFKVGFLQKVRNLFEIIKVSRAVKEL
jgi:hypothetical protein